MILLDALLNLLQLADWHAKTRLLHAIVLEEQPFVALLAQRFQLIEDLFGSHKCSPGRQRTVCRSPRRVLYAPVLARYWLALSKRPSSLSPRLERLDNVDGRHP